MSLLIKGMDMPTSCFYCRWRVKINPNYMVCDISGKCFEGTLVQSRPKACPLVAVPLNFNPGEQRGYQLKPDGNFGYQPVDKYATPPSPPTTGSNIISPPTYGRLNDDDVETIRGHLNAIKEDLCNQHRWKARNDMSIFIISFSLGVILGFILGRAGGRQ